MNSGQTCSRNILILAGDADGNLGDSAIAQATYDELRAAIPGVLIHAVTSGRCQQRRINPDRPIPKGLRGVPALIRAALRSDLVICGGGGLFQDDDSLIKMPYWAARLLLVRLFARRIVGYSIGAGPLDSRTGKFSARIALACMDRVSARDALACTILSRLTRKPVKLVPDPALLLKPLPASEAERWLQEKQIRISGRGPLIGVALRPWSGRQRRWIPQMLSYRLGMRRCENSKRAYKQYIQTLAAAFDQIGQETGAEFLFLPTYNVQHENDAALCQCIMGHMRHSHKQMAVIENPRLYKAITGNLRLMIAGRMHPAILSADMGVSSVGIAYNQKFLGFFSLLGRAHRVITSEALLEPGGQDQLISLVRQELDMPRSSQTELEALQAQIRAFNAELTGNRHVSLSAP